MKTKENHYEAVRAIALFTINGKSLAFEGSFILFSSETN